MGNWKKNKLVQILKRQWRSLTKPSRCERSADLQCCIPWGHVAKTGIFRAHYLLKLNSHSSVSLQALPKSNGALAKAMPAIIFPETVKILLATCMQNTIHLNRNESICFLKINNKCWVIFSNRFYHMWKKIWLFCKIHKNRLKIKYNQLILHLMWCSHGYIYIHSINIGSTCWQV